MISFLLNSFRKVREVIKRKEGTSEFRYRLFRSSHDPVASSGGNHSAVSNSHSCRHNRHKLGNQMGSWNNRRLTSLALGAVIAGGVLSAPPAFAVEPEKLLDLDSYQNLTGTDSSYWTGKTIASARYDDYTPMTVEVEDEYGVKSNRASRVQWACPEVVDHFTDCTLYITITEPELAKKVQLNGDNNIYSPKYGIADKANYYLVLGRHTYASAPKSGSVQLRVPLLYNKAGNALTTIVDFDRMRVNTMNINGDCNMHLDQNWDDCTFGSSSNAPSYAGLNTAYPDLLRQLSIFNAMSIQQKPINGSWNAANGRVSSTKTGWISSYGGSLLGKTFKEVFAGQDFLTIGVQAFWYSDFTKAEYSFGNQFYECITRFECGSNPVYVEGAPIEPYALAPASAISSGGGFALASATNGLSFHVNDNNGVQPRYDEYNNLSILQVFGPFTSSNQAQYCNSPYDLNSRYFTCSGARDYLETPGNTTDEEGKNCVSNCVTNFNEIIDYGNDQNTIDPYDNPADRPDLGECMSFVPVEFDWDCISLSLFAPDMGMITSRLSEFGAPLQQVLFPLSYASEFVSTGTGMLNLLHSDTCSPIKANFPLIGPTTMLPCPADSPAFAQLASVTRVLVPFIIFASVGVLFVRRLMARFGFAGREPNLSDSSLSIDATTPAADVIHEAGRNINSLTDPNSLVNKQLGGKR